MGCIDSGCRSSRVITPSKINLMPDFCVPSRINIRDDNLFIYYNPDSLLQHENSLNEYLSKKDILTANATGSLDLLDQLANLLHNAAETENAYLEYTTAIEKNIALVRSEVDNVSTELECEIIRCRQLSSYLANLNSKRNARLTVGAIVAGSITTITPIFIKKTSTQNAVLITGGIITAGLGLLTLNPRGKLINLVTPNNMLTDIWFENKSSLVYPASIWYILNDPGFSNLGMVSKCQLIRTRWTQFELEGSPDHQTEELLFGNGGLFDQGSLETRATMLTEVMAYINSIRKDLDGFTFSLNDLKLKVLRNSRLPQTKQ
jgi:hypothetical protein